jgi:uncharacterized protein YceK
MFYAPLLIAIIIVVVLVVLAMVLGGAGAVRKGPKPSEGDKGTS